MASSTEVQRTYPPLLSKVQTAELYGVTPRTIDRWLLDDTLPANAKTIIGGSVRFRTAVLMDHINGTTTANNAGGEV